MPLTQSILVLQQAAVSAKAQMRHLDDLIYVFFRAACLRETSPDVPSYTPCPVPKTDTYSDSSSSLLFNCWLTNAYNVALIHQLGDQVVLSSTVLYSRGQHHLTYPAAIVLHIFCCSYAYLGLRFAETAMVGCHLLLIG